jgi:hypothetical protein
MLERDRYPEPKPPPSIVRVLVNLLIFGAIVVGVIAWMGRT